MRRLVSFVFGFLAASIAHAQQSAPDPWSALLERYVAWDEAGRKRPDPWSGASLPTPQDEERLYANPPKDPRQALGLALFAMSNHRHPEMRAVLATTVKNPAAPPRAHALFACFLVPEGRYAEALAHLDAASPDGSCGLTAMEVNAYPLHVMRAIALRGVGKKDEARALLANVASRSRVVDEACLLGDFEELDGNRAAAESAWTAAGCRARLEKMRAVREPFEVLRAAWPHGSIPHGALASAMLGDADGARAQLEADEASCARPEQWRPDCLRLGPMRTRLAPALLRAPDAASLRSPAPFTERDPPWGLIARFDPDGDEPEEVDDPPEALSSWYVVRVEHAANEVFAVSAGREATIDDGGDMLPLYRLHVSRDGGTSFEPPILLGLEPDCPCRVRTVSRIPIVRGDDVQLEMLCKPAVRGSETLVPRLVAAPMASLTRDADADGLSDAQEHAWRLDPTRADTDGDTVPDGRDASPRVPPGWTRPELDSFLEWLVSDDAAKSVGVEARDLPPRAASVSAATAATGRQEPLVLQLLRPLPLLRSSRGVYNDRSAGPRVIALSQTEADSCGESPFLMNWSPTRLRVVFDLDGSRALVSLGDSYGGRADVAVRHGDTWTLHGIVGWVH